MTDNIEGTWEEVFQRNEQAERLLAEREQQIANLLEQYQHGDVRRRGIIRWALKELGYSPEEEEQS